MRVAVCVPWRGGDASRERIWFGLQGAWERRGLPVFEGDSNPALPFNRAEARNVAAEMAGDVDVYVFVDADTYIPEDSLYAAIDLAHAEGIAVMPYTEFVSLNPLDPSESRPRAPQGGANFPISGNVVVSRAAFEAVGGWDEDLSGYGWEDGAFLKALIGRGLLKQVEGRIAAYEHNRTEDEDPNLLLERGKPDAARAYDTMDLDALAHKVRARRAQRAHAREGAIMTAIGPEQLG